MNTLNLTSQYDGLNISVTVSRPMHEPIAVLQLVHGLCGCKERFAPMMEFLSNNGIVCISSDLRGHGKSIRDKSDLGYFYSGGYRALVDDIRTVTNWGKNTFSTLPLFMLGHSMGSLAVRIYTKYDDSALSGLILCGSPSKNPLSGFGGFLTGIACMTGFDRSRGNILQSITDKNYNKNFKSEGPRAWVCSDKNERTRFAQNPQCNFNLTMNGANNLMKMMGETYNKNGWCISNPTMPILFISGGDDPCMISQKKFQDAIQSMRNVGYKNVKYTIYPNMRHEVLNELNKHQIWNQILNFVKQH